MNDIQHFVPPIKVIKINTRGLQLQPNRVNPGIKIIKLQNSWFRPEVFTFYVRGFLLKEGLTLF